MIFDRPVVVAALLTMVLSTFVFGQGVCIPGPVEVERIEGMVVFTAPNGSRPLADVKITVSPYAYDSAPLASAVTGGDGQFFDHWSCTGSIHVVRQTSISSSNSIASFDFGLEGAKERSSYSSQSAATQTSLVAVARSEGRRALNERGRSLEYRSQNQVDYGPLKVRRVEGFAADVGSAPVPGTCLALFSEPDHRLISNVETDENGHFAFDALKPGRYRLVAFYEAFGVANVKLEIVAWPSGGLVRNRALAIHLRPSGIDTTSYVDWKRRGN